MKHIWVLLIVDGSQNFKSIYGIGRLSTHVSEDCALFDLGEWLTDCGGDDEDLAKTNDANFAVVPGEVREWADAWAAREAGRGYLIEKHEL